MNYNLNNSQCIPTPFLINSINELLMKPLNISIKNVDDTFYYNFFNILSEQAERNNNNINDNFYNNILKLFEQFPQKVDDNILNTQLLALFEHYNKNLHKFAVYDKCMKQSHQQRNSKPLFSKSNFEHIIENIYNKPVLTRPQNKRQELKKRVYTINSLPTKNNIVVKKVAKRSNYPTTYEQEIIRQARLARFNKTAKKNMQLSTSVIAPVPVTAPAPVPVTAPAPVPVTAPAPASTPTMAQLAAERKFREEARRKLRAALEEARRKPQSGGTRTRKRTNRRSKH